MQLNSVSKKKRTFQVIALVVSITLFVLSIAATSIVLFQKFYYTTFWVNGQSMYPTLNKDAHYKDGTLIGERRNRTECDGDYNIDYGFMDTHQRAVNNIKRFDIIIFKPREDILSYNIKRVIALPGETFYITSSINADQNGNLYIKNQNSGLFEYVGQPVNAEFVKEGKYPTTYTVPTTLGPNQYFVMGDNRKGNNSDDSRQEGPITKDSILGVAVGLHATCSLQATSTNVIPVDIKHHWPRWL